MKYGYSFNNGKFIIVQNSSKYQEIKKRFNEEFELMSDNENYFIVFNEFIMDLETDLDSIIQIDDSNKFLRGIYNLLELPHQEENKLSKSLI